MCPAALPRTILMCCSMLSTSECNLLEHLNPQVVRFYICLLPPLNIDQLSLPLSLVFFFSSIIRMEGKVCLRWSIAQDAIDKVWI